MKKVLVMLLILALVLSGCAFGGAGAQESQPSENAAPSVQEQPEDVKPTPVPGESQEPGEDPIEEPSEEPSKEPESYLLPVPWAGLMIFDGPSYDAAPVQPLPVGTYTIVEGAQDDEGLQWGKLKSGLGWICVSHIRRFSAPVSIGQAEEALLNQETFSNVSEDTPYGVPVVIQACEDLTQLRIYTCQLGEETMEADELIYEQQMLEKAELLVVRLSFPGDFSAYHVCFRDADGTERVFQVSISGRNGTVETWDRTA